MSQVSRADFSALQALVARCNELTPENPLEGNREWARFDALVANAAVALEHLDTDTAPASPSWAFDVMTRVRIATVPGAVTLEQYEPLLVCTLAELFDSGEDWSQEEREAIRGAIRCREVYKGGGGASPVFTIEWAP